MDNTINVITKYFIDSVECKASWLSNEIIYDFIINKKQNESVITEKNTDINFKNCIKTKLIEFEPFNRINSYCTENPDYAKKPVCLLVENLFHIKEINVIDNFYSELFRRFQNKFYSTGRYYID